MLSRFIYYILPLNTINYLYAKKYVVILTYFLFPVKILFLTIIPYTQYLTSKLIQNFSWTKPMELVEALLKLYQLQEAWFSDDVHFYGILS